MNYKQAGKGDFRVMGFRRRAWDGLKGAKSPALSVPPRSWVIFASHVLIWPIILYHFDTLSMFNLFMYTFRGSFQVIKSKPASLCFILLVYLAAFGAGGAALRFFADTLGSLVNMFLAVSIATVLVYIFNLLCDNASVYDPFWSVQPLFIAAGFFFILKVPFEARQLIVLVPLCLWSIRLTLNWAIGFDNLAWQDWRYRDIKKKFPRAEKVIVFIGIMYMPTCFVFLGTVPLWFILTAPASGLAGASVFAGEIVGGAVILLGTALELAADTQMKSYKRDPKKPPYIDRGLWRYSRHPNYLGEILIWGGLFIAGLRNFSPLSVPGVTLIIVLFTVVSIPMMEKHLLEKTPEYNNYRRNVSALIPWRRRV
jgi:steroid 5-alpha reductase family enzyme